MNLQEIQKKQRLALTMNSMYAPLVGDVLHAVGHTGIILHNMSTLKQIKSMDILITPLVGLFSDYTTNLGLRINSLYVQSSTDHKKTHCLRGCNRTV